MNTPQHWFRISLFRVMVLLSLICVLLATYVRTQIRAGAQRQSVLALRGLEPSKNPSPFSMGSSIVHPIAEVYYDFEKDAYQSGYQGLLAKQPTSWWGKQFGYDLIHNVEIVDFHRTPDKNEIKYLKDFPQVKNVILDGGVANQAAWDQLVQFRSINRLEYTVDQASFVRKLLPLDHQMVELEEQEDNSIVFRDLHRLHRLTELVVKTGQLKRTNLTEIAKSGSIETLRLLDIHILREDLLTFPEMPNVEMFCWQDYLHPLDDHEFRFLEKMPNLKIVVMAGNYEITDLAIRSLAKLKQLEKISLHGTKFTGSELHRLDGLKHLVDLELPASQLNDAALEILAKFPSLQRLEIGSTEVTDAGMRFLAKMQNLRYLSIRSTSVSDRGLHELARLKNLRYLRVNHTSVTDEGIDRLKLALPACLVDRN